jgi:hypothetical protein
MLTDVRKTDMTKLTVAFRYFAKPPKQETKLYMNRMPKLLKNEILEYDGGRGGTTAPVHVR